ncbi:MULTISPECIES: tripartite tricarboxylate transporter substrate binding protein [unclassified Modestobacter]|uniref:tripartite tricarboxylate transporter substrate binding protein n=1 Tax=unclassified Modestobacter TaxID=2643866 RepID=UPI0022AA91F1|nr:MULTISPECIES: tripartite tricarboxylate transporter substrate binding protein [unclassified Modestobacter]MCZ2811048.1 tripartite tricarboxylate transporter substrate binding protein [Modestobacter sp. VKM Ac-2979]MCZ2840561.1 tripartite tricarboxylate transporter substrate binding protein [Modestobacter sp. VKM Ac-2980]MCZ2847848.1 tripartite tricarboxylate transporter substrate binding protein [Modestobacter sp. VKM Ac-2978]
MQRRRLTLPALLAASALTLAGCGGAEDEPTTGGGGGDDAAAADYPTDDITLYVPYAAGGPTDLAARTIGDCLSTEFGQTVVVENREGASGAIGMQAMLAGGADGYSLSLIAVPATATNPLQQDVGYTNEDYLPVAAVTEIPSVLAVGADSEYADAEAFFQAAEENPGQLNIGVPGATTSQAMEVQRMAEEYDVQLTAVPFTGNAEMTTALLGGNVDAVFINASEDVLANIEAGEFVPLAVSPPEQVDYLEGVPTLAESGFPELTNSVSVFGLAAPAGTPDDVVTTLEETVNDCLEQPEVMERLGEQYVPDEFIGTDAFADRIDEIVETYGPILQE